MQNTSTTQVNGQGPSRAERGRRRDLKLDPRALGLNPFPWYQEMRAAHPVYYDKENEFWHIFRYEDTQRILNDPATFSSEVPQRIATEEERKQMGEPSILTLDPPRHRQLRSLISQAFTPRTVARLTPRITEIINTHLDKVASAGRMDVIADLAYPLPVIVIAELLGVPTADQAQFKHWSDNIVSTDQELATQSFRELREYLKQVTNQRRQEPREDMISELLAAQVEGKHLTEGELLSFYTLLLVAGNETTTNLIGNAFLCFDEHPEVIEQLRAQPELLPGAIEEVLRYRSPVQRLIRIAGADVTIGGQTIKEGELVSPWVGSANRDEAQFPQPDVFDIRRTPNRHLAFGHGIHFCIGAPLSRLEAKIALGTMFERFRDIRLDSQVPLQRIPAASAFFGVQELPLLFTAVK